MKVLAFGTFDLFHKGHESFLKQAKALGDELVVGISRDTNVKKHKGSLPINNEAKRKKRIEKLGFVDTVFLAREDHDYIYTIREIAPDIICLGYDQPSFNLVEELGKNNLSIKVVRAKPHNEKEYKSSIIRNIIDQ